LRRVGGGVSGANKGGGKKKTGEKNSCVQDF
jgi:hypothetical protein